MHNELLLLRKQMMDEGIAFASSKGRELGHDLHPLRADVFENVAYATCRRCGRRMIVKLETFHGPHPGVTPDERGDVLGWSVGGPAANTQCELRPGERIVDGERLYSADWLNDDRGAPRRLHRPAEAPR